MTEAEVHIKLSEIVIDNDNLDYIKETGEICGKLRWDLVKLFAIPAVVERSDPLFCPKCNSTQRIDNDNDAKYTCSRCGTRWAK